MPKTRAMIYADRLYHCADGKTAHGLVRCSKKFDIVCVIDSTLPIGDAAEFIDGKKKNIPLLNNLDEAFVQTNPDVFIIGAVSEGGLLPKGYEHAVEWALSKGLDVISGLHQFLSDDPHYIQQANKHHCTITDIRKLFRDHKIFYTGAIKNVQSVRIALIGTDSAIGKRTLAVLLVEELKKRGRSADMIFTGQTGWLQGWPHGIILDAMINDFVSGGIEGAILDSWNDLHPEYMIIEGQGSLVHPFFPGGFEILAASQVQGFILVDAPKRPHLDGFPGYAMPDPRRVVKIAELLTEKKLIGIGINHEYMSTTDISDSKQKYQEIFNVPVSNPLSEGVTELVDALEMLSNDTK
jgi:uncharacterized NAD-dependent epimerase/dehydratase family protein